MSSFNVSCLNSTFNSTIEGTDENNLPVKECFSQGKKIVWDYDDDLNSISGYKIYSIYYKDDTLPSGTDTLLHF